MNKLVIIGNLTRDPDPLRVAHTAKGDMSVCSFGVAVNAARREHVDFFHVSVWGRQAENCSKYLAKGRKVAVTGPVSLHEYTDKTGKTRTDMEINAEDVEFLSPVERGDAYDNPDPPAHKVTKANNNDHDDLPF